ncbi:S41 family peptidase [Aliiglaciecola sp. CAU 1673]|uniref:S41 family peptidase n=1 Tax=Aliiglaciecola sp. CAU 1673 TaxID=3032595 RepID=UPI0023DB99E6|nr:S41 family peptidase [Aliiglaciecola sp. CAU 1673]MDF2178800.1 S41 family peptidase [Aliiglaciecola sp. CAU 1673]
MIKARWTMALLALFVCNHPALSQPMSGAKWREDLQALQQGIRSNHVAPFTHLKPQQLQDAIDSLSQRVDTLNQEQMLLEIGAIVALMQDGHSFVAGMHPLIEDLTGKPMRFASLPIRLYQFSDGVFITHAHQSQQQYVGAKVLTVEGMAIKTCMDKVVQSFPSENALSRQLLAARALTLPAAVQHYCQGQPQQVTFELQTVRGKERVSFPATDAFPHQVQGIIDDPAWRAAIKEGIKPDYLRHANQLFWHRQIGKKLYVQINQIKDDKNKALLDYIDDVAALVHQQNISHLILDLRLNPGGETDYVAEIVKRLAVLPTNQTEHFFVLIGRRTFSAAQLLSTALEQYTHALFIGEPTGSKVHFFANSRQNLVLPNSQLPLYLSTSRWQLTNMRDSRQYLAPQYYAPLSFTQFQANQDPVLEAALNFPGLVDFDAEILAILDGKAYQHQDFVAQFRQFKAQLSNRYRDTETNINDLGYFLIEQGKLKEANALFAYNVEDYPDSANALDSLAESFLLLGDKQQAIHYYQVALEKDPHFDNAAKMLKTLSL